MTEHTRNVSTESNENSPVTTELVALMEVHHARDIFAGIACGCGAECLDASMLTIQRRQWHASHVAEIIEREYVAARVAEAELRFIKWLADVLHYPFDFAFDTPPPVDHDRLADYLNESDGWNVTPIEARAMVWEEAGLRRSRDAEAKP